MDGCMGWHRCQHTHQLTLTSLNRRAAASDNSMNAGSAARPLSSPSDRLAGKSWTLWATLQVHAICVLAEA